MNTLSRSFISGILLLSICLAQPLNVHAEYTNIQDRITSTVGFIANQLIATPIGQGYLHAPRSRFLYSMDSGIVALALSAYEDTHFTDKYYSYLKLAVQFTERMQVQTGDFYQYYDVESRSRFNSGNLYSWDPFVTLGLSYAAFVISEQVPSERQYWMSVIDHVRMLMDNWLPSRMLADGSLIFEPDGQPNFGATAAVLVSLVNIAVFEQLWGDRALAAKYASWAHRIALWLTSLQERNSNAWGYGGFYTDKSRQAENAYENGLIMWGLDSYYSALSLIQENTQPNIQDLRGIMALWEEQFVEKILDGWGGPQFSRTSTGYVQYPKTTLAAASLLQAAIDVWIDLGPSRYWNDAKKLYEWIIGNNELSFDLQTSTAGGGFYEGIELNRTINSYALWSSGLALYALIRAGFVLITGKYPVPEFADFELEILLAALASYLVVMARNKYSDRHGRLGNH